MRPARRIAVYQKSFCQVQRETVLPMFQRAPSSTHFENFGSFAGFLKESKMARDTKSEETLKALLGQSEPSDFAARFAGVRPGAVPSTPIVWPKIGRASCRDRV